MNTCVYCLTKFKWIYEPYQSYLVPFELSCCGKLVHACCLLMFPETNCKNCKKKLCFRDLMLTVEKPISKMPEIYKVDNLELMDYWKNFRNWCIVSNQCKCCL